LNVITFFQKFLITTGHFENTKNTKNSKIQLSFFHFYGINSPSLLRVNQKIVKNW